MVEAKTTTRKRKARAVDAEDIEKARKKQLQRDQQKHDEQWASIKKLLCGGDSGKAAAKNTGPSGGERTVTDAVAGLVRNPAMDALNEPPKPGFNRYISNAKGTFLILANDGV